jgi:hypothetical protein
MFRPPLPDDFHHGLLAISRSTGAKAAIRRMRRVGQTVLYAQLLARPEMTDPTGSTTVQLSDKFALEVRGAVPAVPDDCARHQDFQINVAQFAFPSMLNLSLPSIAVPAAGVGET